MEVYRWETDVCMKGKSALNKACKAREEAAFSVFHTCSTSLICIIKQGTQKTKLIWKIDQCVIWKY